MVRYGVLLVIAVVLLALGAVTLVSQTSLGGTRPGISPSQAPRPLASNSGTPPAVAWPTYLYNPQRTGANEEERTIAPSNVSQLQQVWTLPANGSDFSAPIVVNNTLYYGSWNGFEYAVNVARGSVDWSSYLGTDEACGGYTPMGISSTPAYVNGTLYLGGGNGYWYALNATTGQVDWSYFVGALPGVNNYDWASALVFRNSLYIGVSSCFDNPLIRGALIQVNLTGSHTANHTFYTVGPNETGDSIWTTPTLDPGNNTIWISTGNENSSYPIYANAIIGLNASNLNVLGSWQVPDVEGEDSDFGSTPTLFDSASGIPLVVATDKNGVAYALNRSNVSTDGSWAPVWSLDTGGGFSSAAFEGGTLYLAGNGLYAVDPSNGSVLWENPDVTGVYSGLTWANGIIYAGSGSTIYAVDSQNGTTLWNSTVPGGGSIVAESVVVDGRLYVPSGNYGTEGNLTAYGLPFEGNASANPTTGLQALNVEFGAHAEGGLTPYRFRWLFGDGTAGEGAAINHTYLARGNATARVWINDSAGDSVLRNFTINVIPYLEGYVEVTYLNISTSCPGTPSNAKGPAQVLLVANATGGVPPLTYHWTFTDGAPAVGAVVVHNLTQNFTANLTIIDSQGHTFNLSEKLGYPSIVGPECSPPGPALGAWLLGGGVAAATIAVVVAALLITRRRRRPEAPPPEETPS